MVRLSSNSLSARGSPLCCHSQINNAIYWLPYDNSVMESFFSSLKREELYRTKYRSEAEFRAAVDAYMVFYNERRPHAKNGYKTPMKLESIYFEGPNKPEICPAQRGSD